MRQLVTRLTCSLGLAVELLACSAFAHAVPLLRGPNLQATVLPDGSYSIATGTNASPVLVAGVAAKINGRWVSFGEYPGHQVACQRFHDSLGAGSLATVAFTGLATEPDLGYTIRVYDRLPFGDLAATLDNHTGQTVGVQALRLAQASGNDPVDLGGPPAADRVLSDSYSEDDPQLRIRDLGGVPEGLHRAVGLQLVYNRQSRESLLLAALTSERFLTMIHLHTAKSPGGGRQIGSLTIDSAGTTEAQAAGPLHDAPAAGLLELKLALPPGQSLASERVMFALGTDYHQQLEAYGKAIRVLHHARVSAPAPMGWWSWTACYGNIDQPSALENARWLAANLKSRGFNYFHIDAGYAAAEGDYTTPDPAKFPAGLAWLGKQVSAMGLRLGIWTAPFEVSERSQVYQAHRDWLVRNDRNEPLQVDGFGAGQERKYALDPTHPAAQRHLRETYHTIVQDWGARYFKLDFMETTAVEGRHYRPNTTAVEAERIGLQIIRAAVGDHVLLDKDGSPMLAPVGLVDAGRLSVDTGHSFWASQETASGIAARYYMNRNFFISDPDAFTVSRQSVYDHSWPDSTKPLSLSDAQVSLVLAALAGGMYEIGDNLKILWADPDRVALIQNPDLLAMARSGRAAVPLDLMDYSDADHQPSVFWWRENRHQGALAVFNWTEAPTSHTFIMAELGLPSGLACQAVAVLDNGQPIPLADGILHIQGQPPHSVRVIKLMVH